MPEVQLPIGRQRIKGESKLLQLFIYSPNLQLGICCMYRYLQCLHNSKSFKSSLDLCKCISVSMDLYKSHKANWAIDSIASNLADSCLYWLWANHRRVAYVACLAVVQLALFTSKPIMLLFLTRCLVRKQVAQL